MKTLVLLRGLSYSDAYRIYNQKRDNEAAFNGARIAAGRTVFQYAMVKDGETYSITKTPVKN